MKCIRPLAVTYRYDPPSMLLLVRYKVHKVIGGRILVSPAFHAIGCKESVKAVD